MSAVTVGTMRAAVLRGAKGAGVDAAPVPQPGSGEVRVRIEGCGVCASNLPAWEGRSWFEYPLPPGSPGHEGWGRVDAVGEGVTTVAPGDRVALISDRAYAEFDVAPEENLAILPAALDGVVFPGESIGCAMNVFRRSRISAGENVAVIGVGFLGAILVRLAAEGGARVIAISRREFALDVARSFGAAETIPMDDHYRIIEQVKRLTGGRGCERVIEVVGQQWPLDLAGELTAERGRLVIAGYHQDGARQVNMQLWNWRGLDVVNAHERDPKVYVEGIRAGVDAVTSGRLDLTPFYREFPLDRIDEAFRALERRDDGFLKAVVRP
jgi:threonine dehydrogenase-like Zn-dependent dehydrogenase